MLQALHKKMKEHRAIVLREIAESDRLTKTLDHLEEHDVVVTLAKMRIVEERLEELGAPVKPRTTLVSASSDIEEDTNDNGDGGADGEVMDETDDEEIL